MVPVATFHFLAVFKPVRTSSSVMLGWSREWSIIFARPGREMVREVGRGVEVVILNARRAQIWVEIVMRSLAERRCELNRGVRLRWGRHLRGNNNQSRYEPSAILKTAGLPRQIGSASRSIAIITEPRVEEIVKYCCQN